MPIARRARQPRIPVSLHRVAAIGALLGAQLGASAQPSAAPSDGAATAEPGKLPTVTVTAERRRENARDVPNSISVINPEQLDAITRDGLVLAPQTVADINRAEARRNRWTAAALWVIAALLVALLLI